MCGTAPSRSDPRTDLLHQVFGRTHPWPPTPHPSDVVRPGARGRVMTEMRQINREDADRQQQVDPTAGRFERKRADRPHDQKHDDGDEQSEIHMKEVRERG